MRGPQFRRFLHQHNKPLPSRRDRFVKLPEPDEDQHWRRLVLSQYVGKDVTGRKDGQSRDTQGRAQAYNHAYKQAYKPSSWPPVPPVFEPPPHQPPVPQTRPAEAESHPSKDQSRLHLRHIDLRKHKPNRRHMDLFPASFWIRYNALPWLQLGDTTLIAFADEETVETCRPALQDAFGDFIPVLAPAEQISDQLWSFFRYRLAHEASSGLPVELSSRMMQRRPNGVIHILILTTIFCLAVLFPTQVFTLFCSLAICLLILFTALKLTGVYAYFRPPSPARRHPVPHHPHLPLISVLVPLYQEAEISQALLRRLQRLTYPKSKREVFLVLEEGDTITQNAVTRARLPEWIHVIEVPEWGDLRTKPRAMNFALNFCRGAIIGVWDAEDAPQSDQLEKVAAAFATADTKTACFQGVLDFYNPHANWISRCFTLEYASWFRIVLPGIARLRLVVPLGGTTMFIRRRVLEELKGWDAHNVTEDADLGVRLCRAGYRTEMLPSVTYEEANCTPIAWMRQRSRWLKGFMLTYLVHMRHPALLMQQLGPARFFGFQAFFLGTLSQFLLAPFLWSFWLVLFGLPHPSAPILSEIGVSLAAAALVFFELLGIFIAVVAAFAAGRPALALWAPCLSFYFAMGAVAIYKALHELMTDPFYWDKTTHGHYEPEPDLEQNPR